RAKDCAVGGVPTIDQLAEDAHYRERGMFLEWEDPVAGRVRGAGIVPRFESTPGRVWRGAPWLGQDNAAVFGGCLGLEAAEIARLSAAGIIGANPPAGHTTAVDVSASGGPA
ncbi:MAG: CoA transferase, partial [Thermoplasmata archaeon]|nr:CoA transferase [Thermoplasmata archaeon]